MINGKINSELKISNFNMIVGNEKKEVALEYLQLSNWDESQAAKLYFNDVSLQNNSNSFFNDNNNFNYISECQMDLSSNVIDKAFSFFKSKLKITQNNLDFCKNFDGKIKGLVKEPSVFLTSLKINKGIIILYNLATRNKLLSELNTIDKDPQNDYLKNVIFFPIIDSSQEGKDIIKQLSINRFPCYLFCKYKSDKIFYVVDKMEGIFFLGTFKSIICPKKNVINNSTIIAQPNNKNNLLNVTNNQNIYNTSINLKNNYNLSNSNSNDINNKKDYKNDINDNKSNDKINNSYKNNNNINLNKEDKKNNNNQINYLNQNNDFSLFNKKDDKNSNSLNNNGVNNLNENKNNINKKENKADIYSNPINNNNLSENNNYVYNNNNYNNNNDVNNNINYNSSQNKNNIIQNSNTYDNNNLNKNNEIKNNNYSNNNINDTINKESNNNPAPIIGKKEYIPDYRDYDFGEELPYYPLFDQFNSLPYGVNDFNNNYNYNNQNNQNNYNNQNINIPMSDSDIRKDQDKEMKELEKMEEERIKKEKEEKEKKRIEEEKEKQRLQKEKEEKELFSKIIPSEPDDNNPDKCVIIFRLPDGEKNIQRKFLKTDKISVLYDYIRSLGREIYTEEENNNFSIIQTFPYINFDDKLNNTLEEEGLYPNSMLQIKEMK